MGISAFATLAIDMTDMTAKAIIGRIFDILKAPIKHPEMLWIIIPVIISMVLISYYFGKYKKEELGWNTAFGNSIVLLFSCLDLFRYLYVHELLYFNVKAILVSVVLLEGVIIMLLDFLHAMPKSLAYGLSSGMTVNVIVISLIILVYSTLPFDSITAVAMIIISAAIIILLRIMQFLEWGEDEEEEN